MRKLLASLLFLPFLFGGSGGAFVPVAHAPIAVERLETAASGNAQLPLPAHLSAAGFAAPPTLLEIGSVDNWRTPTRGGRASDSMLPGQGRSANARTHLERLQRSRLEFRHTLARARANQPTTYGNPPPASST